MSARGFTSHAIRETIKSHLNAWAKVVAEDNQAAASAILNGAIVTGGAIASMLQGEQPNDIDVYFKDRESATIVAQHYIDKMVKLGDLDYHRKVSIVNSPHGGISIAIQSVGTVFGTSPSDIDTIELDSLEETAELIQDPVVEAPTLAEVLKNKEMKKDDSVAYMSSNAITLKNGIQIILRFTGSAEEIHENFDFIHATNVYDYGRDELIFSEAALLAILQKRLVYVGSKFPIATLFRVRKFIERGFTITAGELTKISFDISRLDLTNAEVLKDQLMGCDQAYMGHIINLIRSEKKGAAFDRTYLFDLINRVFDGEL